VTDAPPAVDLPRFSRQIGVTGLGQIGSGDAEPRPFGVLRPFRGVLAAGVGQRRVGGTSPQLAYLTLTSLVDYGLWDRRAEAGQHDGVGRSATTETVIYRPGDGSNERASVESEGDDATEEPTVLELLRTREPESADEASETSEWTASDGVARDVSMVSTLDRVVRQLTDPDAPEGGSQPANATGWTEEAGVDSRRPSRTVVDRSTRGPDGVETTGSDTGGSEPAGSDSFAGGPTGSDEPTVGERLRDAAPEPSATAAGDPDGPGGPGTERGVDTDLESSSPKGSDRSSRSVTASAGATVADRVEGAEPVGTVLGGPGFPHGRGASGSDGNETVGRRTSETVDDTPESRAGQPRMTVVHGQEPVSEGEKQPRLRTVSTGEGSPAREQSAAASSAESSQRTGRQPQATGQRSEVESSERHGGRSVRGAEPRSGAESVSTPPTVIAADGSVNDRVLDRLYAELRRKERIERDREGR
jgi:hypothetical protein